MTDPDDFRALIDHERKAAKEQPEEDRERRLMERLRDYGGGSD